MRFDCSKCDAHFECNATAACRCDNENVFFGVWHPYPQEKPTDPTDDESMEYLVTVIRSDGTRQTCSADYSDGSFWWGDSKHTGVIAWMELPKPYEG